MSSRRSRTPAKCWSPCGRQASIRSTSRYAKDDRLPYTLGRDFSGVVEKCGAQATRFKVGDEVFGIVNIYGGGYSAKAVVDERAITLKPAGIDHIHAAAIPLAGQTAWQGLFRHGELKAGQTVLILGGSGGVGHHAIQFAKARDARVLPEARHFALDGAFASDLMTLIHDGKPLWDGSSGLFVREAFPEEQQRWRALQVHAMRSGEIDDEVSMWVVFLQPVIDPTDEARSIDRSPSLWGRHWSEPFYAVRGQWEG
jgi:hypothetical protein